MYKTTSRQGCQGEGNAHGAAELRLPPLPGLPLLLLPPSPPYSTELPGEILLFLKVESSLHESPSQLRRRCLGTEILPPRVALFLGQDSSHSFPYLSPNTILTEAPEKRQAPASCIQLTRASREFSARIAASLALLRTVKGKKLVRYLLHCGSCLLET